MSHVKHSPNTRAIPTKRILLHEHDALPNDYSTTPGGTMFSTTPGGTRIVYERQFLMQMRSSPVSRTPPRNLPLIQGVTNSAIANTKITPVSLKNVDKETTEVTPQLNPTRIRDADDPQFSIEM